MMQPTPDLPLTHSNTLRRLLHEAFGALGHDPRAIYRAAYPDLDLSPFTSDSREAHDLAPQFWQRLPALTGDDDIGLHLGECIQPRPLDVVGYLQLASRDLGQALEVLVRYQHLLSGGFALHLQVHDDRARLVFDLEYLGGPLRQQMECLALLLIKQLGQLSDGAFELLELSFRHPEPRRLAEHRRLYGLTPRFAAAHDALEFPAGLLQRPSRNAAPALFEVLQRHAEQHLAELQGDSLVNRVRYWLAAHLGQADCDLRHCAAALGQGRGDLQRRLQAHGSGFRSLLEEARRLRSRQALEQGLAIREVARACGFADLSPFYRAFRRWWGCTPAQWLQRRG